MKVRQDDKWFLPNPRSLPVCTYSMQVIASYPFLILTIIMVVSSIDNVVQAKTVSCSCTLKSQPHKVVTKSAKCKAGASKTECCVKAAKSWTSMKNCKYEAPAAPTPELGSSGGTPSSSCDWACNTTAGSQCVDMSGGKITNPLCTCNTAADCIQNQNGMYNGFICAQFSPQAPQTYKNNVCGYACTGMLANPNLVSWN